MRKTQHVFIVGDPFDVETNPRIRLERVKRIVESLRKSDKEPN